jgi:outer membrane protein W
MKRLILVTLLVMGLASLASAEEFEKGKIYLGPTVGLAWSGLGLGVNGEYAIDKNWGIGGEVSYTSFGNNYGHSYKDTWTFIGVLAAGSYHFTLKNSKLDPYLKAGLGYFHWGVSHPTGYEGSWGGLGYNSGIGFEGAAGVRYFFSPSMAGRAQVGFPFYLSVGIDFALGGK